MKKVKKTMKSGTKSLRRNINSKREKVEILLDYYTGIDGLPKENVLKFLLEGHGSVVVRPSGTEPKLKMYLTAVGTDKADALRGVAAFEEYCNGWVNA